jgi:hypothetical protein
MLRAKFFFKDLFWIRIGILRSSNLWICWFFRFGGLRHRSFSKSSLLLFYLFGHLWNLSVLLYTLLSFNLRTYLIASLFNWRHVLLFYIFPTITLRSMANCLEIFIVVIEGGGINWTCHTRKGNIGTLLLDGNGANILIIISAAVMFHLL